ncbi:uncharacterized protein DS421_9g271720 [Arachis hypogaea]|nr:uncharacterized protein DS421_9g271720 [Arachis hypogaea]
MHGFLHDLQVVLGKSSCLILIFSCFFLLFLICIFEFLVSKYEKFLSLVSCMFFFS